MRQNWNPDCLKIVLIKLPLIILRGIRNVFVSLFPLNKFLRTYVLNQTMHCGNRFLLRVVCDWDGGGEGGVGFKVLVNLGVLCHDVDIPAGCVKWRGDLRRCWVIWQRLPCAWRVCRIRNRVTMTSVLVELWEERHTCVDGFTARSLRSSSHHDTIGPCSACYLFHACFLLGLLFSPVYGSDIISSEHRFIFSGLHGVISQRIEHFIATAVRTSDAGCQVKHFKSWVIVFT
jgi:hypothetical protein